MGILGGILFKTGSVAAGGKRADCRNALRKALFKLDLKCCPSSWGGGARPLKKKMAIVGGGFFLGVFWKQSGTTKSDV